MQEINPIYKHFNDVAFSGLSENMKNHSQSLSGGICSQYEITVTVTLFFFFFFQSMNYQTKRLIEKSRESQAATISWHQVEEKRDRN